MKNCKINELKRFFKKRFLSKSTTSGSLKCLSATNDCPVYRAIINKSNRFFRQCVKTAFRQTTCRFLLNGTNLMRYRESAMTTVFIK